MNLHPIYFCTRWIFTWQYLKHGESWTNIYCIIIFFDTDSESWPRKKKTSLLNLYPTLFSWWWMCTELFWRRGELKGVLHLWTLFLKTLRIFSKNKATLDKVSYGSGQKCSKEFKNHSFTSVETIVVKLQWKMCENQYFPCFEP